MGVDKKKSGFIEPEKEGEGYTETPTDGRIACQVHNLIAPGTPIEAAVNNWRFQCEDGATIMLHPSQIEALNHTVIETIEHVKINEGTPQERIVPREITIPQFVVNPINMPGMEKVKAEKPIKGRDLMKKKGKKAA